MALTKVTGQVIKNTTDVTVGVLTVTNTLAVGGTVSIGGTLTYEDVTNVDAVGLITARNGIVVGSGITLSKDGDGFFTGIVTATTFSGALAASNLTGALPAISGANLTNLDASDLASGTVPTARLGSGTASSSTFLRGDSTFAAVTSTTINNNADNRVITGSGTANTLEGEANLTFNGTNFTTKASDSTTSANAGGSGVLIQNTNNTNNNQNFLGFYDSTGTSSAAIIAQHENHSSTTGNLQFGTRNAGTYAERLRITSAGTVLHGSGAVATQKATNGGLDVACNGLSIIFGADSNSGNPSQARTNNTVKDQRIASVHYTNAEEPIGIVRAYSDSSTNQLSFGGGSSILNAATQISFYTASNNTTSNGTERLRITSTGEMGLGTATPPTGCFHIHLTETPELNLFSTQHSQGNNCKLNFGVGQSASVSGNTGARIEMNIPNAGGQMNGELKFHTNAGDNLLEKVRIPASTWGLLVTNLASTGATGGYQTEGVSLRYGGDSTFVKSGGPPVTLTRKTDAGKVLDFYNATTYAGGIYVNGSGNTAIQQTSDYRLKKDVSSMTDGITKVKLLNPIYYKNNTGFDTTTTQNGFLAHEIQGVLPTLVDGEKDGNIDETGKGYQTMDYAGLTPTLTAAIKELIAKVETLESEVAALKSS